MSKYYLKKNTSYFNNIRNNVIELIPSNKNNRILELGCGSGITLQSIKARNKAAYIAGIDIIKLEEQQRLDKIILADIENLTELPFLEKSFDIIICADVLEHLVDPWTTAQMLLRYLREGGLFIVSLPNFREIWNLYHIIIKGNFNYEEWGIRDKTHLRFFCKSNIMKFIEDLNLKITHLEYELNGKKKIFNHFTLGTFEQLLVINYLVVGRKI